MASCMGYRVYSKTLFISVRVLILQKTCPVCIGILHSESEVETPQMLLFPKPVMPSHPKLPRDGKVQRASKRSGKDIASARRRSTLDMFGLGAPLGVFGDHQTDYDLYVR